MKQRGL